MKIVYYNYNYYFYTTRTAKASLVVSFGAVEYSVK